MPPPPVPLDLEKVPYASPDAIKDLKATNLTKRSDFAGQAPHDVYQKFLKNSKKEPTPKEKQRVMNTIRLVIKYVDSSETIEAEVQELKDLTIPDVAARAIVLLGKERFLTNNTSGEPDYEHLQQPIYLRNLGNELYDQAMELMDISPEQAPALWGGIFAALAIMQAAPGPGPIPIRPP